MLALQKDQCLRCSEVLTGDAGPSGGLQTISQLLTLLQILFWTRYLVLASEKLNYI